MENLYRIAIAIIYFTQFFGIIYFNKKSNVDNVIYSQQEPKYLLFIRGPWVILGITIIIVYIFNPYYLSFANLYLLSSLRIFGILFGIVIDILLFWTFISLGKNISTSLSISKTHKLITIGPYKYVRHPMYILGILLFASLILIASNWIIGIWGICFQLFVIIVRTPLEEKMLENYFGNEFEEYKLRTGLIIPKIIK